MTLTIISSSIKNNSSPPQKKKKKKEEKVGSIGIEIIVHGSQTYISWQYYHPHLGALASLTDQSRPLLSLPPPHPLSPSMVKFVYDTLKFRPL